MTKQTTFAHAEFRAKKKQTRRERFLGRMEEVIPWAQLLAVIAPHYPKGERGRPPIGLERMLRVYFLQQWYALADEALEDALYDSQALQRFAGIELDAEGVPDAIRLLAEREPAGAFERLEKMAPPGTLRQPRADFLQETATAGVGVERARRAEQQPRGIGERGAVPEGGAARGDADERSKEDRGQGRSGEGHEAAKKFLSPALQGLRNNGRCGRFNALSRAVRRRATPRSRASPRAPVGPPRASWRCFPEGILNTLHFPARPPVPTWFLAGYRAIHRF
jgi:hypothetical protein